MIRNALRTCLLLAPLAGCGCNNLNNLNAFRAQLDFQQTADAQGVRTAIIETRNGSIHVQTDADAQHANISGTKYASGATLAEAQQRLDQIQVRVERDASSPEVLRIVADFKGMNAGSPGASFKIILPPDVELNLASSNGSITAQGTSKHVTAQTSNGSITAEDIGGTATLKTTNASVSARRVAGDVEIVSSNGSLQLERVGAGRVNAVTTNASITATEPHGDVTLVSSNGSVRLTAGATLPKVKIRTTNAGVRVHLPPTMRGAVRLETSNAAVHSNLGGAQVTETQSGKSSFSAVLNGGGDGRIDVATSNGSIHFDLDQPARVARTAEKPIAP